MPVERSRFLAILFPLVFAASCKRRAEVGASAPPLALERTFPADLTGSAELLRGRPLVIEFWSTWCGYCIAAIPYIDALIEKYPDVQFLSISDEEASVVEAFLAKRPLRGIVAVDRAGATFKAFGVESRPQTALIDGNGILRGLLRPNQITDEVMKDFIAGRPISPPPFRMPPELQRDGSKGLPPAAATEPKHIQESLGD